VGDVAPGHPQAPAERGDEHPHGDGRRLHADHSAGQPLGKRRQLAEECVYVLEGRGYDLHQDCDVEITDTYHWTPQAEVKRYEWEAGDVIYIPPKTDPAALQRRPDRPVRLISAVNRIFRYCGLNDLEQIEDAPEYRPGMVLTAEKVAEYLKGVKQPQPAEPREPAMNDTSYAHERDRLRCDREEVRDREVTPYTRWIAEEGLDIIDAMYVPNLHTVELKPWARRGRPRRVPQPRRLADLERLLCLRDPARRRARPQRQLSRK
jgi:hypothetical protein